MSKTCIYCGSSDIATWKPHSDPENAYIECEDCGLRMTLKDDPEVVNACINFALSLDYVKSICRVDHAVPKSGKNPSPTVTVVLENDVFAVLMPQLRVRGNKWVLEKFPSVDETTETK